MHNPLDLSGRRVLVTGAASGIGRATAILASRLSARVVAVDIDAAGLEKTLSQLEGKDHTRHVCDLSELEKIGNWMTEWAQQGGHLHGLVHAAGIACVMPLRSLQSSGYHESFAINTEAALALVRSFQSSKVYAGEKGSVVLISSVMALVGSPTVVAYSMSKAAIIGMARSMALELAPKRIRVNCVAPGFVHTPMYKQVAKFWDEAQEERMKSMHPLGWGEPEDVANAIAFLLADTARWITGTVLVADGGYTAQ